MVKIILISLFFIVSYSSAEQKGSFSIDSASVEEQFLAGLTILSRSHTKMTDDDFNHYLNELLRVTGIEPSRADSLVADYADDPEEWRSFIEVVQKNFNKKPKPQPLNDTKKSLEKSVDNDSLKTPKEK